MLGAQKGEKALTPHCSNGIKHTKVTVIQCAVGNKVLFIKTEAWEYSHLSNARVLTVTYDRDTF